MRNVQNSNYDFHWHNAMEIIIPIENTYKVNTLSKEYHLNPTDILIIPPCEVHSIIAPQHGLRYIYIIDISFLSKLKGFSSLQTIMDKSIYISSDMDGFMHKKIFNYLLEIEKEFTKNNAYSELTIFSILLNSFADLGYFRNKSNDLFSGTHTHKKKEYIQKIGLVLDYIDINYMNDIAMEEMAMLAGFSKYHFLRIFSEYTNYTFSSYINLKRIKAAEILLSDNELTITEIAMQTGFSSICTFNRVFKSIKNCSPSQFRKLHIFDGR
jgi:AraC-like DNA-binding protein